MADDAGLDGDGDDDDGDDDDMAKVEWQENGGAARRAKKGGGALRLLAPRPRRAWLACAVLLFVSAKQKNPGLVSQL